MAKRFIAFNLRSAVDRKGFYDVIIYETFIMTGFYVEDANNCISKAQDSKPYGYMTVDEGGDGGQGPTFLSSEPDVELGRKSRAEKSEIISKASIPAPGRFSK